MLVYMGDSSNEGLLLLGVPSHVGIYVGFIFDKKMLALSKVSSFLKFSSSELTES